MQTQTPAPIDTEFDRARFTIFARGHYLAVWGLAFSAGIAYAELYVRWGLDLSPTVIWFVGIASACTYTGVRMRRGRVGARVDDYIDKHYLWSWRICALMTTALFYASSWSEDLTPHGLAGCTAAVLGAPFFFASQVTEEGWLLNVAMSWWSCAIGCWLIFPPAEAGLWMAGCLVVFMVVPGVVMQVMARKLAAGLG